jgi:hypothetical protein
MYISITQIPKKFDTKLHNIVNKGTCNFSFQLDKRTYFIKCTYMNSESSKCFVHCSKPLIDSEVQIQF